MQAGFRGRRSVVQLYDEIPGRERRPAARLRLASEKVTARGLIRRRVEDEVAAHNRKPQEVFRGLVQPSGAERALNGYRLKKVRRLDPEEQVRIALEAFESNGFFMLFDDRQVESLDAELVLTGDNTVSFVQLLPLVGG